MTKNTNKNILFEIFINFGTLYCDFILIYYTLKTIGTIYKWKMMYNLKTIMI